MQILLEVITARAGGAFSYTNKQKRAFPLVIVFSRKEETFARLRGAEP